MRSVLTAALLMIGATLSAGLDELSLPTWAYRQMENDLAPWADGISVQLLDEMFTIEGDERSLGAPLQPEHGGSVLRVQIQDNQVTVLNEAHGEPHRTGCVVRLLNELAGKVELPDTDFIVFLGDGLPREVAGPLFCWSKPKDIEGILWPDFEMTEGHPIDQWLDTSGEPRWEDKTPMVFWRGSTTNENFTLEGWREAPRSRLVLYSIEYPNHVDARFSKLWGPGPGVEEELNKLKLLTPWVTREDHLAYRYLFDVDGYACTYGHIVWSLCSHSLLLKASSPNIQWYYRALQPWKHYVPVKADYSDLALKIDWLRAHDEQAHEIARNGRQFASTYFRKEMALKYVEELLWKYSELLQDVPEVEYQ
jgi:hypothetical protein